MADRNIEYKIVTKNESDKGFNSFKKSINDSDKSVKGLTKNIDVTKTSLSDFVGMAAKSAVAIGSVVAVVGVAIAAYVKFNATIIAFSDKQSALSNQLLDNANKVRLSVAEYKGLAAVFELNGSNAEEMVSSIGKLQAKLVKGGKAGADFNKQLSAMGISTNGRTTAQIFTDIIKVVSGLDDVILKDKIATEIFGKSYQSMVGVFNASGEDIDRISTKFSKFGEDIDANKDKLGKLEEQQLLLKETTDKLSRTFADAFMDINIEQKQQLIEFFTELSPAIKLLAQVAIEVLAPITDFLKTLNLAIVAMKEYGSMKKLLWFIPVSGPSGFGTPPGPAPQLPSDHELPNDKPPDKPPVDKPPVDKPPVDKNAAARRIASALADNAASQYTFAAADMTGPASELSRMEDQRIDKLLLEIQYRSDLSKAWDESNKNIKLSDNLFIDEQKATFEELKLNITQHVESVVNGVNWIAQMAISDLSSISRVIEDNNIKSIDKWYNREKEALEGSVMNNKKRAKEQLKLEAEYQHKKEAEQRKGFNREKALNIASAIMSGAVAFMNALKTQPIWLGIALAAATAVTTGVQVGTIAAQKFAKGGIAQGPSTGDQVNAKVNGGEMILTRTQQANLFAMANGKAYGQSSHIYMGDTIIQGSIDNATLEKLNERDVRNQEAMKRMLRQMQFNGTIKSGVLA